MNKAFTIPSPLGGLNAYDNLASMPPTDAVRLTNWVPMSYGCTVRKGYQVHADGLGGPVETLAGWYSKGGQSKLFAFANGNMFDVTVPGTVGTPLLTGLHNDFWQGVSMANAGGSHIVLCNGVDDPVWYSTAGVQRLTAGNGTTTGTINGVDPKTFIQATVHQKRLWFVPVNDTVGWYLPANANYGVVNFFDFGPHFKRGGYLSSLATWTVDAGEGTNDKLVALSSNGEAVVYQGIDVSSPTEWQLVGIYYIGSPIRGRRYFCDVVGDLLYLTSTGLVSMSTVIVSTQVNASNASVYSRKIQFLLSELTTDLADVEGWELKFFPTINLIFINVPSVFFGGNAQLANSNINNAWCALSGLDARTWHSFDGMPFFGDAVGRVCHAWKGNKDNVAIDGSGGTNILAKVQQAYNTFGAMTAQKQVGLYRPLFLGQRRVAMQSKILYDYHTLEPSNPAGEGAAPSGSSLWGAAIWGLDTWSANLNVQKDWLSGEGLGMAASLIMNTSTEAETTWISTDYTVMTGGAL